MSIVQNACKYDQISQGMLQDTLCKELQVRIITCKITTSLENAISSTKSENTIKYIHVDKKHLHKQNKIN